MNADKQYIPKIAPANADAFSQDMHLNHNIREHSVARRAGIDIDTNKCVRGGTDATGNACCQYCDACKHKRVIIQQSESEGSCMYSCMYMGCTAPLQVCHTVHNPRKQLSMTLRTRPKCRCLWCPPAAVVFVAHVGTVSK